MVSTKFQVLGALASSVVADATTTLTPPSCSTCTISDAAVGCASLQNAFPGKTFFPGQEVYDFEKTNFWSNHEILSPKCVFRPETVQDVAAAVITLKEDCTQFAVRGGGHMGIKVRISLTSRPQAKARFRTDFTPRVRTASTTAC